MKSTGILFQSDMIRALLRTQNPKTQTRRIIDPQPPTGWNLTGNYGRITSTHPKKGKFGAFIRRGMGTDFQESDIIPCRFGGPGDELWAKETFALQDGFPIYRADARDNLSEEVAAAHSDKGCWTPSIFMPRWASRITLTIDNIRAERVSEISHLDALAEGREPGPHRQRAYRDLWNHINAKPAPSVYGDIGGKQKVIAYIAYPWALEDMKEVKGVTSINPDNCTARYRNSLLIIKPDPYVWAITFHRKP